jgi:Tfp pilus assembly protein PilF
VLWPLIPNGPVALKNLGAIFSKEGDSLKALYYLRRSYQIDPGDPQTVYGLAYTYLKLSDVELAQKYFKELSEQKVRGWMQCSTC